MLTFESLFHAAVIPPFHNAIDNAISMLSPDGFLGVTDFFVSSKYDLPMRQMSWFRRFFWRWG
jgi:betaine lipid synthase